MRTNIGGVWLLGLLTKPAFSQDMAQVSDPVMTEGMMESEQMLVEDIQMLHQGMPMQMSGKMLELMGEMQHLMLTLNPEQMAKFHRYMIEL